MKVTDPHLVDWLADHPDLYKWDNIMGLALEGGNRILRQTHAAHLSQGQQVDGISGQFTVDMTNVTYHLAGFELSAPQVAIGSIGLEDIRLDMVAQMYGGTLVKAEKPYKVLSLSSYGPLDSLELRQKVPVLGKNGALVLDVSKGEDVRLMVSDDQSVQRAAGDWLQQQLPQDPARLDYPLVSAGPQEQPEHYLDALYLGTQADAQGKGDTLVIFASSAHGSHGDYPGASSGFPRLLPTPPKASDAVQLMSSRMLHRNAYLAGFINMLTNPAFDYRYEEGVLDRVVVEEGQLSVPATNYRSDNYTFNGKAFKLHAAGGLEARFEQDWASQHWDGECELTFDCLRNGEEVAVEYKATFDLSLHHRYYLLLGSGPDEHLLEGQFYSPWPERLEARVIRGLPEDGDDKVAELRVEAADFAAHAVKQAILLGMAGKLGSKSAEDWLDKLQFGAFGKVRPVAAEFPGAMAVSAHLGGEASFSIYDDAVLVRAGSAHKFQVDNPKEALDWRLESLPGGPTHPGFVENGTYRAPPAHTLQRAFGQVLVTANKGDKERSVAVVTVLPKALAANPFITTVQADSTISLSARALGDAPLRWAKVNDDQSGSGELVEEDLGRRCRYLAKASDPSKTNTYWLERLEVAIAEPTTDEKQGLYVLVIQRTPALVVALKEQPEADGSMQFVAYANDRVVVAQWELAVGTGSIDPQSGLYRPAQSGEQSPGILVLASFDTGQLGVFEGHLIMPLQAAGFKGLCQQMLAPQARSA
ncbi:MULTISPECIES: hypothetical protein [unclassified Pseudomonas]|uniref:hypothetical protein n=1 Tax=unclassified Pseudomonas TaxID=196821 RepID=UPI000A1EC525|nr:MULTISPECIES: hypothetical protein [unclassified Pseudomonas]